MVRKLEEVLPASLLDRVAEIDRSITVTGVTSDSRQVKPGSVFVAVRGVSVDGHGFIRQAQQRGAALIVGEEPGPLPGQLAPYVQVEDSRLALSWIAAGFHGHPSHAMLMVGITGTSGKTTTTYLVESILRASGREVGLIGTVAFRYQGKVHESTHTTPGAVELQELLARMRVAGCAAVVMEVSSHALKQHRAAAVAFDAMVFTNLSPEHLDFHPDMEDYFRAKAMLFLDLGDVAAAAGKRPVAAINADDEHGRRLIAMLRSREPRSLSDVVSFSIGDGTAGVHGRGLEVDLQGIRGEIAGTRVESPLAGLFNASNLLGAVAVSRALGIGPEAIASGVAGVTVPGRLERVSNSRGIHVLVDYAHKPDALEKVLETLRAVRGGNRLITVFGCGGDRDRLKRPMMGAIAARLSDQVHLTSDNPRTENPSEIIQEIMKGMQGFSNFTVEPDRRKAIHAAIRQALPGDIVLIAGKGHEDYQIIADPGSRGGTRKIRFDDREVAAEALGPRGSDAKC